MGFIAFWSMDKIWIYSLVWVGYGTSRFDYFDMSLVWSYEHGVTLYNNTFTAHIHVHVYMEIW
jgi:hypothetical protein